MKAKHKAKGKAAAPVEVKQGASAALTRLESEEARLFGLLKEAETTGDVLEVKAARDAWLKVSESLRKFDLIVESAKRELGETVPRAHVEELLQNVGQLMHSALTRATGMHTAWEVADNAFVTLIARYDKKVSAPVQECPAWIYRALFRHGQWRRGADLDRTLNAVRVIQRAMDLHRDNEGRFFSFLQANLEPPPSHEEKTETVAAQT